MKSKKSLSLKSAILAITLMMSAEAALAQSLNPDEREQVIQDIVNDSRQDLLNYNGGSVAQGEKVILKGYWDAETRSFKFERSTKSQMAETLRISKMPMAEQEAFLNARNIALAGLSAGGIIYFVPKKNIIFWETDEEVAQEINRSETFWTNPIVGNLLSGFLSRAQKELQYSDSAAMGSKGLKSFLMLVLNPASPLARQIGKVRGNKHIEGRTEISTASPIENDPYQRTDSDLPTNYIGLTFTFKF
jgi:hypothetical protein